MVKINKEKGSVLIYVLMAIILISIMISGLILSLNLRNRLNLPKRRELQMIYTSESSNYFIAENLIRGMKFNLAEEIDVRELISPVFPELCSDFTITGKIIPIRDSLSIETVSSDRFGKKGVREVFSADFNNYFKYSVFSGNSLNPLIISGKETEITGGVSSPMSIFEKDNSVIDLKSYTPSNILPELNFDLIKKINLFYKEPFTNDEIKWSGVNTLKNDSDKNTELFIKSDIYVGEAEDVNRLMHSERIYIKGNLRITDGAVIENSNLIVLENIYISGETSIKNSSLISYGDLFISGEHHIEDSYIQTGKSCVISGKSVFEKVNIFQTNTKQSGNIKGIINITGTNNFSGFIISGLPEGYDEDTNVQTEIKISGDNYFNGGIINYGTTDFQGVLDGILFSGDFTDGKNGNYLRNVKIDRNKMRKDLVLPLYFLNIKPCAVKWELI